RTVLKERVERRRPTGDNSLAGLAERDSILKNQEQQLIADVARLEAEAQKFGRSSIDLEMMRSEIEALDNVLSRVDEEIHHTRIELRSGSRTTMLSPAQLPSSSDLKKKAALSAFGGLAGFGLPLAMLVWRDASRRRVDGTETITGSLQLDV